MTNGSASIAKQTRFEVATSAQFTAWIAELTSLAFMTYQAGKFLLLGLKLGGRLDIFNRTFERCLGMALCGDTFWLSSLYQLWRFENRLERGQQRLDFDRLYVPPSKPAAAPGCAALIRFAATGNV